MTKAVSLTVHRNRIEKKHRRDLERDMVTGARKMARDYDLMAYAIVGIDNTGKASAIWDTGSSIPLWSWPGTVYRILDHDIETSGAKEDFKKPDLE